MTDETCCGACGYPIHATKEMACDWCRQTADRIKALTANTQDVIAWDRLPEWVEWVARDEKGSVWCYEAGGAVHRRIDGFPGIVQVGTCDWKDSKQRRPR